MHDLKTKQICFECIGTYNVSSDAKLLRKSATFTPASGWKTLHLRIDAGNLNNVGYIRSPVSKNNKCFKKYSVLHSNRSVSSATFLTRDL